MDYIIVFAVIIIVAVGIASEVFNKKKKINKKEKMVKSLYHYRRKDFLISRAEHKFFDVLIESIGDRYYVFPQIHLATFLDHKVVGQNWKGAFRHIDEKSVDFVLCDKTYIKPLLAIELDDQTHQRDDRKKRDREVESILKEAGLPLLRFENHGNFDKEEITQRIFEILEKDN